MKIYTIGFTKHTAEQFFEKLKKNNVRIVIDIRINKTSQLAAFAKGSDLPYLLKVNGNIDYKAHSELAPKKSLLKSYRSKEIDWYKFEIAYIKQILDEGVLNNLIKEDFDEACLLCSEDSPDKCHRRLLTDELQKIWKSQIIHL